MQLREINKARYRKHLRVVYAGIVFALLIVAPAISASIISLFSNPEASYLIHNAAGLIIAVTLLVFVLNKYRQHPYMVEVVYVWDLKQQLNKIHRKQRKIEAAIENNNKDAMIIMNYMNRGSKQLYELDDNTITMEDLLRKIQIHDKRMEEAGLSSLTESFNPAMLDQF